MYLIHLPSGKEMCTSHVRFSYFRTKKKGGKYLGKLKVENLSSLMHPNGREKGRSSAVNSH